MSFRGGAQGGTGGANAPPACMLKKALILGVLWQIELRNPQHGQISVITAHFTPVDNLVPRAMPVRGLGWHWLWGN